MFEPVHGSAPKFAGKNVANPIGAIGSAALMLETLGRTEEAAAIDRAVLKAVTERQVTQDIGGKLGTQEAGDAIVRGIEKDPK
jgi:isocitrate/isopropylmalate dehydrogenase